MNGVSVLGLVAAGGLVFWVWWRRAVGRPL